MGASSESEATRNSSIPFCAQDFKTFSSGRNEALNIETNNADLFYTAFPLTMTQDHLGCLCTSVSSTSMCQLKSRTTHLRELSIPKSLSSTRPVQKLSLAIKENTKGWPVLEPGYPT